MTEERCRSWVFTVVLSTRFLEFQRHKYLLKDDPTGAFEVGSLRTAQAIPLFNGFLFTNTHVIFRNYPQNRVYFRPFPAGEVSWRYRMNGLRGSGVCSPEAAAQRRASLLLTR